MSSGCKRDYVYYVIGLLLLRDLVKLEQNVYHSLDFEIQIILEKILRSVLVSCNTNCLVYLQSYN